MNIPSGNIIFLFTDIEGSTRLAQEFPLTLQAALERHHSIMQTAVESNNGFVFEIVGDAFCCAFEKAEDAVKSAVNAQLNLAKEKWDDAVIKIRIGIHSGNAVWNGKGYMGYITLARAARVMSASYGEQIIISYDAYELCKDKFDNVRENNISFRDLGERRLKDVIKPIRIFQILSPGLREDFPPLKTLDARPNNLPVHLTSFIGREAEMKKVKELLRFTHLLTLTGSGGAGKTRLALQIAEDVIDDFANGVWLVELALIFDPDLLPQAILKVFDLKEQPGISPEETLHNYLQGKEMLIILDNCEHLIEPCSKLAEMLLRNNPKLKILATSREALRCEGEQAHRILSLEVPDKKKEYSPAGISQYEAVRLFIDRALLVNSEFVVNNDNAPALAGICYQLEGIPLAIELAAARTKVLTVEQIYERLKDRFNLLTGGKRTALPRQQTLRALIDWSYDLLSEKEKTLWRRLSVFTGGWTLEAAEKVCPDEKIKKDEILEMLNQLTEKSIIIFERERERYRMLETLKQYGEEKLKEAGEAEDISSRHLLYFMELSETAEPKLKESGSHTWLEKLDAEHCNLKSAIEWSIKGGDKEKGARLAGSLGNFWEIRGHYSAGILLKRILDNAQGINQTSLGKVYYWIGSLTSNQGEYEQATTFLQKSLDIRRELGEKRSMASTLSSLGIVSFYLGDYKQSLRFYEEALALFKGLKDERGITSSLNNIGNIEFFIWNFDQAQKYYDELLTLSRQMEDKIGISTALYNLGNIENNRGNYQQAEKLFQGSYELSLELGDKLGVVSSIGGLGIAALDQRKYESAQKYFEESLSLSRELGEKRRIVISLSALGSVAYSQGHFEQAYKLINESMALSQQMSYQIGIADALNNMGNLELHFNNKEQAQKLLSESLILRLEIGDKLGIAYSIIGLAKNLSDSDQVRTALLLGAVGNSLQSMGTVLSMDYKNLQEKIIKQLHKKLSPEDYLKYFEEGEKLTLEQAAELALSNVQC